MARPATAAAWLKADRYAVADAKPGDLVTHPDNLPRELMAELERRWKRTAPFDNSHVQVAGSHGQRPHQRLTWSTEARSGRLSPFELSRAREIKRLYAHRRSPGVHLPLPTLVMLPSNTAAGKRTD
jgi:hypothetical protein